MKNHYIKVAADRRSARGRNGFFRPVTIETLQFAETVIVEVNSARSWGAAPIHFELAPAEARQLAQALLAHTEGDLVAQVQAEDAKLAALQTSWLSLADADRVTELERTTEQRLAAWARQMLHLPALGAPTVPQTKVVVEWHPEYRGGDWDDMGELTLVVVPDASAMPAGLTDALVAAAFQTQQGQDPIHIIRWQDVSNDPEWADYDPDEELRLAALSNGRP